MGVFALKLCRDWEEAERYHLGFNNPGETTRLSAMNESRLDDYKFLPKKQISSVCCPVQHLLPDICSFASS